MTENLGAELADGKEEEKVNETSCEKGDKKGAVNKASGTSATDKNNVEKNGEN